MEKLASMRAFTMLATKRSFSGRQTRRRGRKGAFFCLVSMAGPRLSARTVGAVHKQTFRTSQMAEA